MSKNMIWITGADGHVGTALHKVLPEHGYHVLCTNKEDVDVTDMDAVRLYAEMNRPTVIINCAALTNPSECEANPEEAYKVNAIGARNLATAAERLGAKLVQMSTMMCLMATAKFRITNSIIRCRDQFTASPSLQESRWSVVCVPDISLSVHPGCMEQAQILYMNFWRQMAGLKWLLMNAQYQPVQKNWRR